LESLPEGRRHPLSFRPARQLLLLFASPAVKSAIMPGVTKTFARVAVPSPLKDPLLYRVPEEVRRALEIGMRVLVPLGKRKVTGVVVAFADKTSLENIRDVLEVLDQRPILDASLLELCQWIAKYYVAPLGEALATALPPHLRIESQRTVRRRNGDVAITGKLEMEILALLEKRKRISLKGLSQRFPGRGVYRTLGRLVSLGAVDIEEKLGSRRRVQGQETGPDLAATGFQAGPGFPPTNEQRLALESMEPNLTEGGFATYLLCGVTGSGKTEVYMRAMETVGKRNKRALMLVPEISLTPQLLDRLRERFSGQVAVLHSALSPADRYAQWWRIARGEATIVLGARSAIFAPVPDLGLIIVDEEHDPSYKQEEGLRYHARDLAVVRGKLLGCPVLLGSATPSVDSYHNARLGRYRLLQLASRVNEKPLPAVATVDLRKAMQCGPETSPLARPVAGFFSPPLIEALQENHRRGLQSLIFLNRRGFANFLQCRLCGFVVRCPHCSISLTFHRKEHSVFCHHCGFRKPATELCPQCAQPALGAMGFGTEKLEEELLRFLPAARVGRMDRDTTSKRGSQERLFRQWERGEIEVLVGTQMIAKGHDVAGVTLVGVIFADLSLNLPDFRAAERTFQLLLQVAGRAGRGNDPGKVIIQTFLPEHYTFSFAATHDYEGFFAAEIEFRRALNYPPFSRLVQLRLDGPDPRKVEHRAKGMGADLRQHIKDKGAPGIEVLGPAPAPIEKLRNRYRWQILLKGNRSPALLDLARTADALCPRGDVRLHVDVDPYNML